MLYFVFIANRLIATISGCEAAWAAYRLACDIAEITDEVAFLVAEDGEIIASSDEVEG